MYIFQCCTKPSFHVYQHRIGHPAGSQKQGQRWGTSVITGESERERSFSATATLIGPLISHLLYLLLPLYHVSSWSLLSCNVSSGRNIAGDLTDRGVTDLALDRVVFVSLSFYFYTCLFLSSYIYLFLFVLSLLNSLLLSFVISFFLPLFASLFHFSSCFQ